MLTGLRQNYWLLLICFLVMSWCGRSLSAPQELPDSLHFQPQKRSSNSDSTKAPLRKKSPRGAVIRAALFPGWGQWYNEKKLKSMLIFGTEIGFISAAVWHNQQVVKPWTTAENYIKEFHINMRNQYVWYLVGTILYSMADAYVDAHLFDFDESEDLALIIHPGYTTMNHREWWIGLQKSF